jgi:hypothetical protein
MINSNSILNKLSDGRMAMKFWGKNVLFVFALVLVMAAGSLAALERAEFINGTQWTQWSNQDKLVYIRGLGNWADFVSEAQTQSQKTSEFSISKVFVNELRAKSLGQIMADVDAYYRDNPGKLNTSVVEVILRRCTNVCPPESGVRR